MLIRLLLSLIVLDLFAFSMAANGGTSLSDADRTAGGADTYSRSDYADYLRKRKMPEYQTERDTKYRFMTPELVDKYARSVCPRENIPAGVAVTTQERDASEWLMERKSLAEASKTNAVPEKKASEDIKNIKARQNSQEAQQRMAQERIEQQIRELESKQKQLESEKIIK